MDFLQEAKIHIERAPAVDGVEWAKLATQLAIACALVALVERLDALTDDDSGKSLSSRSHDKEVTRCH